MAELPKDGTLVCSVFYFKGAVMLRRVKYLLISAFFISILVLMSACGNGGGNQDGSNKVLGLGNDTVSARGYDKVLTIYFAGTKNTIDGGAFKDEELLSTLYADDNSYPVIVSDLPGKYTKYKFFVDGIGTPASLPLCVLSQAEPTIGCRTYTHCLDEAKEAIAAVLTRSDGPILLNLVGFSRGGVLTMMIAHWVSTFASSDVKKINILAYDPVPGSPIGDPIGRWGENFKLSDIVNQYVGVYARDERSYRFEPIIPDYDSSVVGDMLVALRGAHETIVGNLEIDGHADVLLAIHDGRLKNHSNISRAIAERLLTGQEWGEVSFKQSVFTGDPKTNFLSYVDGMYNYPSVKYWDMHWTTFDVFFSHYILDYELLGRDHHLLIGTCCLYPPPYGRLIYRAPERHATEYIWWLPPFLWLNFDQVYNLDHYVKPIDGELAWKRMEELRSGPSSAEDIEPPVPNSPELPTITGECSVTLTTEPTATDNIDGTIKGTTDDPRSYTEQGTYTVLWTYTDKAGNFATQTQTVIVEDTIAPKIESISASPNVLWPPNHKLVEVNFTVDVKDNCSVTPTVVLTSVVINQPDDDGYVIQGADIGFEDYSILLKARRDGYGNDRVYTITYTATDDMGNSASDSTTVTVPHDMRHGQ
jgi:hypothetical protein